MRRQLCCGRRVCLGVVWSARACDLRCPPQTLTIQEAVQKDCEQMVPLTLKKLQAAYEDLVHLMNGLEKDPIAETQQWADAKNVVQIVMNHWQSVGGP